ncbi:hypothetical protein BGZ49_000224 [Haplosporangium sp. Z 27]|nr:hypothetical protein BGZ49_000224 [Haplosporangium sp. Z 27]
MANQSMIVPPNKSPYPELHTHSSTSSSQSHPTHSGRSYPPPPPHYFHHHGHPPPSHQQPYYPYHPYTTTPYPPYPPYHYPTGSYPHPDITHDSSSVSKSTSSSTIASNTTSSSSAVSMKSAKSNLAPSLKTTGKTDSANSKDSPSTKKSSSTSTPKTFRFEGSISSETYKTTKSFDIAGVNILNRKPLDTRTALDKLQRRRETHNRVERKRRDCINQLVDDLTRLLPPKHLEEVTSKCHRVNVLRGAVAHIKFLTETNATLKTTLTAAKEKDVSEFDTNAAQKSSNDIQSVEDMTMDVDAIDSTKQGDIDEDKEGDMENDLVESISSRSSSPTSSSSNSRPASPRLTQSKILAHPLLVVTNSSNSSEKESSQSKVTLAPPPISIITAPTDSQVSEPSHKRSNSVSSFSASPMFPPSDFVTASAPEPSAIPPSPVSPSSFSQQNLFLRTNSEADSQNSSNMDQKLSPFSHCRSMSSSPSLPPVSSFDAIQSSSDPTVSSSTLSDRRRSLEQHASQSLVSSLNENSSTESEKFGSSRTGIKLPPLKIPTQQHLHPSYSLGGNGQDSSKNGHRSSLIPSPLLTPSSYVSSSSPRHYRSGDDQPPISPFMLSPIPRSHSTGSLSSSPVSSPYPHWGHDVPDASAPSYPGHYMPNSLSPHMFPHGYPYPYPYHPSYGYPHPHGPPPPHHPHLQHGSPPGHSNQQRLSSSQAAPARPHQPEPIFIQEEPWVVQRKRSTSGTSNKMQSSSSSTKLSGKKTQEKDEVDEVPISPSSSVTSGTSYPASPGGRKRPSNVEDVIVNLIPASPKRVKQQLTPEQDLEVEGQVHSKDEEIVVVVIEPDSEIVKGEK